MTSTSMASFIQRILASANLQDKSSRKRQRNTSPFNSSAESTDTNPYADVIMTDSNQADSADSRESDIAAFLDLADTSKSVKRRRIMKIAHLANGTIVSEAHLSTIVEREETEEDGRKEDAEMTDVVCPNASSTIDSMYCSTSDGERELEGPYGQRSWATVSNSDSDREWSWKGYGNVMR